MRLVRRALAAFNAEDWTALEPLLDPRVRFVPLEGLGRPAAGRARVLEMLQAAKAPDVRIAAAHVEVLDDGRVLALGSLRAGGDTHPFAGIHELSGDRLVAVRHLYSDAELLERLGVLARRDGLIRRGLR